ncbi:MAG: ubiquinol-cytochrome c reductase iron-sulfur subunit [Acidobacteriales bacterium]|nr:ubiquinol-cytochrome c reductase iron-sulfur subunit [Terriglobales bacterium]
MDDRENTGGGDAGLAAGATRVAKDDAGVGRRSFFSVLLGIGVAGVGVILVVPVLRYVLYPIHANAKGREWSEVGDVSEFAGSNPVRKTITFTQRDGWREVVSSQSVYVSRGGDGQLKVISAICPHLGCSVSWQANTDKFVCPCHGGVFKSDGENVSGPPPRAMDALTTQVKGGKLQVYFRYFRPNVPNQESLS